MILGIILGSIPTIVCTILLKIGFYEKWIDKRD